MRKKIVRRVKSHYRVVKGKRIKVKSHLKRVTFTKVKSYKRRKLPRVLIKSKKQTGSRKSLKKDEQLKAMFSGKRLSKNRKIYYEHRKNRTDTHRDKKGWI